MTLDHWLETLQVSHSFVVTFVQRAFKSRSFHNSRLVLRERLLSWQLLCFRQFCVFNATKHIVFLDFHH